MLNNAYFLMKFIKFLITIFYLCASFFITVMIFSKNFAHEGLKFSVDSWSENQFLIILNSTWMSVISVFLLGICSIFTNFVFVRIIYNNEIREAALTILKVRKKKNATTELEEKSKLPWYKRILLEIRDMI